MKIPFYTSFKEFKDNYETDLEKWLSIYPDGNEDEFLKEVKELYEPFLRWSGRYFFKDLEQLQDRVKTYKTNDYYRIVVTDKESIYLTDKQFKNLKFALPKIVNHIESIINIKKSANVRLLGKVNPTTGEIILLKGDLPYNLSDDFKDEPTTQEGRKGYKKIKVKGSLQSIGYIFSELIDKGWIIPPKRNGKINKTAVARLILEHFELIDRKKPITEEYVRRTISTKKTDSGFNKDKMDRFKIPSEKSINSK
ncbi:hypothetical protein OKE80_05850 [Riemerella anatipestifer]|uniref:hypothetical protein n=1 Tax=Riemerella anatipestifer TaxID=34085 RepID=UPI002096C32E|nr:hypothetical protein [Riemerella anatipestifer]MCO7318876.1 hypothetical protein [Riemerella anatipestifer]MCW0474350.1 hypothetical protein [Riemerella anatipestifer]MDY3346893.1 hypothetical protein [Riemerella anatipestifer]MDY3349217.1 hypothetical protein [Riemerella anatipestifer]MDY3397278.1 hypothetical protein [Riemerella anatipestifer]